MRVLLRFLFLTSFRSDYLHKLLYSLRMGYMMLFALLTFLGIFITGFVITGKIPPDFPAIGMLIVLFIGTPVGLYAGYSRITSQEVELKRQQNRAKAFRQAQGAKPYGYIFSQIILPIFLWLYFMVCVIALILIIAFPPPSLNWHIPIFLTDLGIGLIILVGLYITYLHMRLVAWSIKDLKDVPRRQRQQLRDQFVQDEFEQS